MGKTKKEPEVLMTLTVGDVALIEHALIQYRNYLDDNEVMTTLMRAHRDDVFQLRLKCFDYMGDHVGDLDEGNMSFIAAKFFTPERVDE